MADRSITETLVTFLNGIADDDNLCEWLLALGKNPQAILVLQQTVRKMRAAGDDVEVILAIESLMEPGMIEVACKTLGEVRAGRRR